MSNTIEDLWIPEPIPPQVTEKARIKIVRDTLALGLAEVWNRAIFLYSVKHPRLYDYVKTIEFTDPFNKKAEVDKSQKACRIGAVVAALAYLESGYTHSVDDVFETAKLEADLDGVPEAFEISCHLDLELQALMAALRETPRMRDGAEYGDYEQVMTIGAGCTRHFLQYAVAA